MLSPAGKIAKIHGTGEVAKSPGIIDFDMLVHPGDVIEEARDTSGRVAYILASGASRRDVATMADNALANLRIEMENQT